MKKATIACCLLLSLAAIAQTGHHQLPPLINGAEHPEKVPEEAAWLAQLIASTSSDRDDAKTKAHAAVHRQRMGLDGHEAALSDFRAQFEWIIANEMGMEARHDVGVLATNTVGKIKARLSQSEWERMSEGVMGEREHIAFHDESNTGSAQLQKPHFQLADFQFNQSYNDQGYSQYVSIDGAPNSSTVYVTVYMYGTSNQPWMGTIGVAHSFYITNQWDGNGPNNQSYGAHLANQYVSLTSTITGTWDKLQHKLTTGGWIVCTVVGTFFRFVYDFLTTQGTSYFVWNGQGVWTWCGVTPTCTNPRPWIIDGTRVWVGYYGACNTSGPGWACHGMCVRNPFTLLWSCPLPDTFMDSCTGMPANPGPQFCTPHP